MSIKFYWYIAHAFFGMVPMAVFVLYQQSSAVTAGTVKATPTELSGKPERATKPWIFTIWPLIEKKKGADLCSG